MATGANTETIQLTNTTNNQEETHQIVSHDDADKEETKVQEDENDNSKNKKKTDEKETELIAIAAMVEFEKSLLHKKIEQDVHGVLDENVGWRLKDEKYKCARKLRKKYPNITDKEMMDLLNLNFDDLSNAYNYRCALDDDELKNLVRRKDDRKIIKKRYPLPVFSNKTWKLTTKSDGCLFIELIFEFALLPIYLFAQTFFMFFYLIRGELPVSGTTDLVLHDHFGLNIKGKHAENEKQRKKADNAYLTDDQLPTGYAIKNIFNRERPSHSACTDVIFCCVRGIKVSDYIDALRHYKEQTKKQKITLRIAQRQQLVHRHDQHNESSAAQSNDLTENLRQVDEERNEYLSLRKSSYCDRTSCCCMCPTSWQMAPMLDVDDDGQSKARRIYWTVGRFNNCTPFDMLSWCFSTEKEVEKHEAELNLLGKTTNTLFTKISLQNPIKILLFRLFLCILISILYCLIIINCLSCVWWAIFEENEPFLGVYDMSKSKYPNDCVMEGVIPFLVFIVTIFFICFWASFRAKIKVPNIKLLEQFKLHWYDFDNVTEDDIMRQTVEFNSFMSSQYGDPSEKEMLQQIEKSTTSAKAFINAREEVFRKRVKKRIGQNRLLRFRHDDTYSLCIRVLISFILSILPITFRLFAKDLAVFGEFNVVFVISSFILSFCCCLLFFSFVQHQIFMTEKMDLFAFILNDITTIIKWPENTKTDEYASQHDDKQKKDGDQKSKKKKYGFNEARMDRFKETSETADATGLLSELDLNSLPFLNILEHGNALAWVEMRSWLQGMIKALLSKVDLLLILIVIFLFLDASCIIFLVTNYSEYGNQQIVINGIAFGALLLLYLAVFNLYPLLLYGPKLSKLQSRQLSSLEKQKLMATNIVNNAQYFGQFARKDKSGLWHGKLKKFAPNLGLGFLNTTINVVKGGDLSAGVVGKASSNLFLKSTGLLAGAAFPTLLDSLFKKN